MIEIKLKGDFSMKRIYCKCNEGISLAYLIPKGIVLESSAKVIKGRDLVL